MIIAAENVPIAKSSCFPVHVIYLNHVTNRPETNPSSDKFNNLKPIVTLLSYTSRIWSTELSSSTSRSINVSGLPRDAILPRTSGWCYFCPFRVELCNILLVNAAFIIIIIFFSISLLNSIMFYSISLLHSRRILAEYAIFIDYFLLSLNLPIVVSLLFIYASFRKTLFSSLASPFYPLCQLFLPFSRWKAINWFYISIPGYFIWEMKFRESIYSINSERLLYCCIGTNTAGF